MFRGMYIYRFREALAEKEWDEKHHEVKDY